MRELHSMCSGCLYRTHTLIVRDNWQRYHTCIIQENGRSLYWPYLRVTTQSAQNSALTLYTSSYHAFSLSLYVSIIDKYRAFLPYRLLNDTNTHTYVCTIAHNRTPLQQGLVGMLIPLDFSKVSNSRMYLYCRSTLASALASRTSAASGGRV